jgi:hypothetical protein
MNTCQVTDCININPKRLVKGYCLMHYHRWKTYGDPGPANFYKHGVCIVDGCDTKAGPTGACRAHWHKVNQPNRSRKYQLSKYGMTELDYEKLLASQNSVCKVCKTNNPGSNYTKFAIDHDHSCCPGLANSCGQCVRGLLCSRCNMVLGMVSDDTYLLDELIDYLQSY